MIAAILHGKQQPTEDILTSSVFGLLQYFPPEKALFRFLEYAEFSDVKFTGVKRPLANLPPGTSVTYRFWPRYSEAGCKPCEPDVELRLEEPAGKTWLVMVEAKYLSGKSSQADTTSVHPVDQLASEWDNLTQRAQRARAQSVEPLLIYLTAHVACPDDELAASRAEFESKRTDQTFQCAWLSWRELVRALDNQPGQAFSDLCRMMRGLNLVFFGGVSPLRARSSRGWLFQRGFRFTLTPMQNLPWRFKK